MGPIVYMFVRRVFPAWKRFNKAIESRNWSTQMVASSPILKALNIKKSETTIDIRSLDLERSMLCNGPRAISFYVYLTWSSGT